MAHAVIINKDWSGRDSHGGIWEGEFGEGGLKGFLLALPKKQNIRFLSDDNNPQWSYSLNSKKRTFSLNHSLGGKSFARLIFYGTIN